MDAPRNQQPSRNVTDNGRLFQTTRTFNHPSQYTKRDCGVFEMDEKRTTNY